MKADGPVYCALDIGTAVVKTVIAQALPDSFEVCGFGIYPSHGMRKGQIIDLKKMLQSVRLSYEQAQLQVGLRPIDEYVLSLGSQSLQLSSQRYAVGVRQRAVSESDLKELEKKSFERPLGSERKILHTMIRAYAIDHNPVDNPIGIRGIKLEGQVSHLHVAAHDLRTRLDLLSDLGIQVHHVLADPLVTPLAVLNAEQREASSIVIDLGAGTTKMSLFIAGSLAWVKVWPVGSEHLTNDLAEGLGTSRAVAEVLKVRHGALNLKDQQIIEVPLLHQRDLQSFKQCDLNWILRLRLKEIFELCLTELKSCAIAPGNCGVVLTGGGSQLPGVAELAQEIFQRPARVGIPENPAQAPFFSSPCAATVIGLLHWMFEHQKDAQQRPALWQDWCKNLSSWMAS